MPWPLLPISQLPYNSEPNTQRQRSLICLTSGEFWPGAEDLHCSWCYLVQRLHTSQDSSAVCLGELNRNTAVPSSRSCWAPHQNLPRDQVYFKFWNYRFNSCLPLNPRTSAQVCLSLLTLAPKPQANRIQKTFKSWVWEFQRENLKFLGRF